MPRSSRTIKSKPKSSAAVAKRYKLPTRKQREAEEENTVLQPKNFNMDDGSSLPSSTSGDKRKTKTASKNGIGRPPLPQKKVTKKQICKKRGDKEEGPTKEGESTLKKLLTKQNSPTIAPGSRTPMRPRRRAAATKKKPYADINSDTDDESSSSDESEDDVDYRAKKEMKIKTKDRSCARKTNKRKMGTPVALDADRKKQKVKTPSPLHPATKMAKSSPSIGLTPIKESVSKVWENDGGDWRVQGAIDYSDI